MIELPTTLLPQPVRYPCKLTLRVEWPEEIRVDGVPLRRTGREFLLLKFPAAEYAGNGVRACLTLRGEVFGAGVLRMLRLPEPETGDQ